MTQRLKIRTRRSGKHDFTLVIFSCALMLNCVVTANAQAIATGGIAPTLNVMTAILGSEPTAVISTSSQIVYSSGGPKPSKITVMTSCPNQKFSLTVVAGAIPPNGGTAASAVTLTNGMLATDFITNIKKNSGPFTVTLQYTASSLFSQGTGTDSHTVTYTVTQ